MARTKTNKSQLIRDYRTKHPDARPAEIIKALKPHKISPALVSNVLNRVNGGTKRGKKGLTVETLIAARELANRLGGLEAARSALNVLEKVGT